jgi:hypothetical protein
MGEIFPPTRRGVSFKGLRDGETTDEALFLGDLVARNERENPVDSEPTGDVAGLDPRENWCNRFRELRATFKIGRGVGKSNSTLEALVSNAVGPWSYFTNLGKGSTFNTFPGEGGMPISPS